MKLTKRTIIAASVCILSLSCVSAWSYKNTVIHDLNSPRGVLERVLTVNTQEKLKENEDLFSPKGFKFFRWILSEAATKASPSPKHSWQYGKPLVSNLVYDLPVITPGPDGESREVIRMIKMDGEWKFDDIYYDYGPKVSLRIWGSEFSEHPYRSVYSSIVRDIKDELPFIKDLVKIGAGLLN